MPALIAVRFNPAFKAKYDQLIQVGKPAKIVLTEIMRKLIVMANALLLEARFSGQLRHIAALALIT